ncbi:HAD family hydrolase [Saccharopolyspora sp. NPDC047091]|uniref:HAD family hydrolase n=1 Tax=Saccharopolyspora sp. NPDC047091 TaxID=3155924 RepID=UPI0034041C21
MRVGGGADTAARHIVWDWNGTLLDDNDAVVAAVNAVCAEFGRDPIDLEHWRSVFSRPLQQCYERLLERPLTEADWNKLDVLYHQHYRELLHTARLAPGVPDELRTWAAAGRTQSLLSMWFHDELVPLIAQLELAPLFERVDGLRTDVGGGAKAEHLERHLAAQRLHPADVVLIGDVLDDARAAEQIGTGCVLVTTGVMSRSALESAGVPVVDSIPDALELITEDLAA